MKTASCHAWICALLLLAVVAARAEIKLGAGTTVHFASVEQAADVLGTSDDFVQRLSPFDRAARLKTSRAVSEKEFLQFVTGKVLPWSNAEREKMSAALDAVQAKLAARALPLPKDILLIRTTGDEEGQAAYTRAHAIIFPTDDLAQPQAGLEKLICHELFHILSRTNPALREALYRAIGFEACDEVAFPAELQARKITNPDAPRNDHCLRVQVAGEPHWVIPILFAGAETYDEAKGGEFFNYLQFRFLLVERTPGSSAVTPLRAGGEARHVGLNEVSGFFEQVGRNTRYIIHPEEILADNFSLLVLGGAPVASPEILQKLEAVLNAHATNLP
ncbi:hypothetical protein ESB00_07030 [Oleiharenicola lentus]|uniref:DUF4157 domain-containing protein n=1 Tax=Oleiharenicola lentus TaxID=2508720 RepID=A0A4Q1C9H3_9BACT|nr:hypothetical protein [Oleiharenicola lentus]RXK55634.1 hypothetical protein ESB00_07030 [Oleiharenicola lentus]